MRPVLYVILDGLGDRPIPALGDRTPLEAAAVPHLISLARRGRTGLVQPAGVGTARGPTARGTATRASVPSPTLPDRGGSEPVAPGFRFAPGDWRPGGN